MKQTLEGVLKYLRKNYCSYWIILGIDTAIAVLCTWIAYIGMTVTLSGSLTYAHRLRFSFVPTQIIFRASLYAFFSITACDGVV